MQDPFRKTMIVSGSIIFGSIVLFFLLFAWLGGDIQAQADAIATARQSAENDASAIESFAMLKRNVGEADQYAARLNLLLPSRDELSSFSRWVGTMARTNQVNAQALFKSNPSKGVPGTISSAEFTMDAAGPYLSLKEFLNIVENKAPRFLVMYDNLTVTKEGENYHAIVGGRVFFKQ